MKDDPLKTELDRLLRLFLKVKNVSKKLEFASTLAMGGQIDGVPPKTVWGLCTRKNYYAGYGVSNEEMGGPPKVRFRYGKRSVDFTTVILLLP